MHGLETDYILILKLMLCRLLVIGVNDPHIPRYRYEFSAAFSWQRPGCGVIRNLRRGRLGVWEL